MKSFFFCCCCCCWKVFMDAFFVLAQKEQCFLLMCLSTAHLLFCWWTENNTLTCIMVNEKDYFFFFCCLLNPISVESNVYKMICLKKLKFYHSPSDAYDKGVRFRKHGGDTCVQRGFMSLFFKELQQKDYNIFKDPMESLLVLQ
jgi:hypothetical protein